jgi:Ca2+/Na+ antiporter
VLSALSPTLPTQQPTNQPNNPTTNQKQVYGAVVLNSTLCLGCFLAIIYSRHLPWTFASEVLVIILPTLLLGFFATRRRSWPAAWGLGAMALYPLVLLMQLGLMKAFPGKHG